VLSKLLYGDDDPRMRDALVRFEEASVATAPLMEPPEPHDRHELWSVGGIEVLWLPEEGMGAVLIEGVTHWIPADRPAEVVDLAELDRNA
jgi:hypothetical protein